MLRRERHRLFDAAPPEGVVHTAYTEYQVNADIVKTLPAEHFKSPPCPTGIVPAVHPAEHTVIK